MLLLRLALIHHVAVASLGVPRTASAQDLAPQVEQRIETVEAGLMPAVRIVGEEVKWTLAERMQHHHVPGVSIAVIDSYRVQWAKGYGVADAEQRNPMTADTRFQAASVSKPVFAMACLRLVEQGLIDLDSNVNDKLKSWKVPQNDFTRQQPVTLRELLSHTAGTTVHGFPGYKAGADLPTLPQILNGTAPANTAAVRVDKLPGAGFRYSGGGTMIAQMLIEDVAEQPLADFMHETLLAPLGMTESTYEQPLPEALRPHVASAHDSRGKPIDGRWHVYPEQAAAGLWTTPADLARYVIEVQRAWAGKSSKMCSRETARLMLTPQNGGPVGLGPMIETGDSSPRFSHGGSNEGFCCMFVGLLETGQGAVVMTNSDGGGPLLREVMSAVAAAYDWPDYLPPPRKVADVPAQVLKQYSGLYVVPNIGGVVIKPAGRGRLSAVAIALGKATLYCDSQTSFFSDAPWLSGRFEVNDDGAVELVVSIPAGEFRATKQ